MFQLGYITWDVSPFIYEGEHFAIGWYGTLATISSLSLLVTYILVYRYRNLPIQYAVILYLVSTILTFFCGHLFHGLFYEWYYSPDTPWYFLGIDWDYRNYYFDHPWKFFDLAHGGFSSHGCVLGGVCTALLLRKVIDSSFKELFDIIMLGSCSMLFIRVGNLINSEIYGGPTSLPWGFLFNGEEQPCHPTQIYEILIFLAAYIIGWWILLREKDPKRNGLISGTILVFVFVLRFLVEFIKNPQGEFESGWILNMGQWLSIPYILLGGVLLYQALKNEKCL